MTVHFNIDKIGLILSVQYWSSSSILRWTVNIEFQFWIKMSTLKFNFDVPKACPNEALLLNWAVNVEFQCWGEMAMLQFNIEVLKACPNEA